MANERDKKIRMHEKKERAHLKKRKGKILLVLEVELKIEYFVLFYSIYSWYHNLRFYLCIYNYIVTYLVCNVVFHSFNTFISFYYRILGLSLWQANSSFLLHLSYVRNYVSYSCSSWMSL